MSRRVSTVGILLAAGAGTRFGMPKILAAEGEWLRIAVSALADGGCDQVVVVMGAAIVDVPAPATAVLADDWATGLSASVRAGIDAVRADQHDYLALHTVDTPDIGANVIRRVLVAATDTGLARATYRGRPGHPVVIARRHWDALAATLTGDAGARAFLAGRTDVVSVECGDLAGGADIDERSR